MGKILDFTKKSFTNPAILYVISRYGTYIIQFVNSLFIAVYLGPMDSINIISEPTIVPTEVEMLQIGQLEGPNMKI